MAAIDLPYLVKDRDRHGNLRYYVRLPNAKKVRVKELPGTAEFLAAYRAAMAKHKNQKAGEGSFLWLCQLYFGSPAWRKLDVATQQWRRQKLEELCKEKGALPVDRMLSKHVKRLRDELADKPAVANKRLKALKALFAWGLEEEHVGADPAASVKFIDYNAKGHHTWTLAEVDQYEQRHPLGTKARLAMALLLYTACRREDAVRLGPQHVRNGRLAYRQAKNEHRKPVDVDIPLHPDLAEAIEACKSGHLTFITTEYGKPFTTAGFGNKFRDWCDEAGLPHCSAHGLRKATATRLAERGATPHEIMAITGHQTLQEVERYTKAAQKRGLADSAMKKMQRKPPNGGTARRKA